MKIKANIYFRIILFLLTAFLLFQNNSYALSQENKISEKIVMALISGRTIVAKNQMLINNPDTGDKGLTTQVFIRKMLDEYKSRTGESLISNSNSSKTNKILSDYLDSVKKVLDDAQPLINKKGKAFKGFIPAIFGRYVGNIFTDKTGIMLKQTSVRYRNRANKPDDFEKNILSEFDRSDYPKGNDYSELTDKDGHQIYRYMKPLYVEKACLQCHGEPAGDIDIAGRKKEGYREGDLRGAISVAYPVN